MKAYLKTGDDENINSTNTLDDMMTVLLLRSLHEYNPVALRTMIATEADIEYIKFLGWHFVTNYIPEVNNS